LAVRHHASLPLPAEQHVPRTQRGDWQTIRTLLPYLWEYKVRVIAAVACLVAAKVANVGVPVLLKHIVDALDTRTAALFVPLALLFAYGLLRLSTTLFTELREYLFAKVTQRAVRKIALQVFRHLHALSLRFHLARQTGGLTRDVERGQRGISSLISFTLFSILPTLVEIGLVSVILATRYDWTFVAITAGALVLYIAFTIGVTEWRTHFRREMNELDSKANTRAIDSLINYETVKYFGNEEWEARRYDESMQRWEKAAVKSQTSLSTLNVGQSLIIAVAVTLIMWRATVGVVSGRMTVGDLVLVNAFMIQLYIPLNFLGVIYREIKQALADMERLFGLIEEHAEIRDRPGARPLGVAGAAVRFEHVDFHYEANRQILHDVSFTIPAGHNIAVVGPSGSGKSTLARLLFRFYDVSAGRITIDGQDIRGVTQASLRASIGIVPQDTVLFNDSIEYNIAYGRPDATHDDIVAAARLAQIHDFVLSLPAGYATPGRRAGPQALGRRKAARRHRPGHPEAPRHPDLRRGDLGARLEVGKVHPGRAEADRPRPDHPDDRPPPCPPSPMPTRSSCSTTVASSSAAPTPPSWPRAACTHACGGCSRRSSATSRRPPATWLSTVRKIQPLPSRTQRPRRRPQPPQRCVVAPEGYKPLIFMGLTLCQPVCDKAGLV
jgi:ATP-binding cassette subfamily B protein